MVQLDCRWTVKEKVKLPISHRDIWHPVITRKNTFTNLGLTNLASAVQGGYTPPNFLVLESNYGTLMQPQSVGDYSATTSVRLDLPSDTDIVLGIGLANQEVCTITTIQTAPDGVSILYSFATPLLFNHAVNEPCSRQVYATDTLSSVTNEQQYDAVNATTLRLQSVAGYSAGPGNWTTQFYFPANTAVAFISHIGLTDNIVIGNGVLHNHVILGYDHTGVVSDVEIDGSLTLTN